MKVTAVESFSVEVPLSNEKLLQTHYNTANITRIRTDQGLTGYGFHLVDANIVSQVLVGKDPFQIEQHLEAGLDQWYGAENALWDIMGKAANLPLHKLLGGYREEIPLYLTCIWPGAADQTDVTPKQQAEDVLRYVKQGYKAVKIRIFRPDLMEDIETIRLIRELVGGPDKVEVMVDRTAQYSGTTWDYSTALRAARALEKVDATWLEEPFTRGDIKLHARLRNETEIAITGGEHQPAEAYRGYMQGEAFDIIQPHCANMISTLKKIAGMAEMFGVECIFHGSHGMDLVYSLQVAATIRTCRTQELVYTTPPTLPEDAWSPLNQLVKSETLYTVKDGCLQIPQEPGMGIELDEDAIEYYRIDN